MSTELHSWVIENLVHSSPEIRALPLDVLDVKVYTTGITEVLDSGPLYDEAVATMAARNMELKHVVSVKVDTVEINQPGTS